MCGHRLTAVAAAVLCACLLRCDNPFFPPTGTPPDTIRLRSTPRGVVDQLILSYESTRIDLFQDLFSEKGNFRFYISPSFVDEYLQKGNGTFRETIPESLLNFVSEDVYYYWTYSEEIRRHQRLFEAADEIRFTNEPYINNVSFTVDTIGETLEVIIDEDSVTTIVTNTYDTTHAEIDLQGGEFEITAADYSPTPIIVGIERQVFYLERDPADPALWVVVKWFDLSRAG